MFHIDAFFSVTPCLQQKRFHKKALQGCISLICLFTLLLFFSELLCHMLYIFCFFGGPMLFFVELNSFIKALSYLVDSKRVRINSKNPQCGPERFSKGFSSVQPKKLHFPCCLLSAAHRPRDPLGCSHVLVPALS